MSKAENVALLFLLSGVFVAFIALNLKAGKTIWSHWSMPTVERQEDPLVFWLIQAFTAVLAASCAYQGVLALLAR